MKRQHLRLTVDLYVNKLINGVPHLAMTRDLSSEGMYLHRLLEPRQPVGAHLAVEFELPETGEVIWAEAEVMHDDPREGVGLRFKDLSPRVRRRIQTYVQQRAA